MSVLMLRSSSVTDHLFEVAVEVNFSQDADESWDQLARSLLLSVKSLVSSSRQRKDRKSFPLCFRLPGGSLRPKVRTKFKRVFFPHWSNEMHSY